MSHRSSRLRTAGLLLAGVLVGVFLVQPVGAHFTQNTKHLGSHAWQQVIKKKVYTRAQANNRYYTKAQLDRGAAPACTGVAPDDVMVKVGGVCIDAYEASIWDAPVGGNQITGAIPCAANGQDCHGQIFARSVEGVVPRANITWFQDQAALANSGKRLPSNAEWQMAVQGTPDDTGVGTTPCNTRSGSVQDTGANPGCVSHHGTFDQVGNLWEWVADWQQRSTCTGSWGTFSNDLQGLCGAATDGLPGALARGGSFVNGTFAGVFAVHAGFGPSLSDSSLGFRGAR
jgi:formylglycine-generating enzyme required for sulfatase activity